jgi:hypothetical protein
VAVRAAPVAVAPVVIGLLAGVAIRIREARHRARIPDEAGDAVGARVRPEVGVERAVLLHDDHDVADLVDPVAGGISRRVPMPFRPG